MGGNGSHNQEPVLLQAGHCQVSLNTPLFIEPLGVDNATGCHVDVGCSDAIQHRAGITALDHEFRHGRHWSNIATESRTARHSAAVFSNQFWCPKAYSYLGVEPGSAYHWHAPSHSVRPCRRLGSKAGRGTACGERRAPFRLVETASACKKQTQALSSPVSEVGACALEGMDPAHLHTWQVNWNMALLNPLAPAPCQRLPSSECR